jgi:hypothetical protein
MNTIVGGAEELGDGVAAAEGSLDGAVCVHAPLSKAIKSANIGGKCDRELMAPSSMDFS